jgi:dTDP-glucose pyrophosphorylase
MVAEKLAISDLCCTGLYYFRRVGDFRWAYRHPASPLSPAEQQECYVAPLYNALIASGERIAFTEIASSQIVFCGTPQQYEEAAASEEISRRLRL